MKNNKGKITGRIILGVVITLVLVYIVFLFVTTNFLGSDNIVTETAYKTTAYEAIKTTALVVRDEECISSDTNGVMVYQAADGDKVTVDGVIAQVYSNEEDVVNMQRIEELTEKIEYLETLNSFSSSVNVGIDTVNSQINEKLVNVMKAVNTKTFDYIGEVTDDLMSAIYRKQIITGEQKNFTAAIEELKEEKASLEAQKPTPVDSVKTADSGYFVSSVDGYEKAIDVSSIDEVSYAQFKSIQPEQTDENRYIGKIIKGVGWYLLCPISYDDSVNISHNSSDVKVKLPYAVGTDIPAKVRFVKQFADEEQVMLVLECNYMNEALSKIRNESVEIVINEYEGLKIPKSAIHDDYLERENEDGTVTREKVQGVYVNYGNELIFRQISILYSGDTYVICDENPNPENLVTGKTISLYDQVVIEGSDLFNGKLIE